MAADSADEAVLADGPWIDGPAMDDPRPAPVEADPIEDHPSPNQGERRDGLTPRLVVIHYTAMASEAAALERLRDPQAEVSAHYLIGRHGGIRRLVPEERRAWHAGVGSWGGEGDVNSRSIGIEIDNDGASPFSASAMAALEALLPAVLARWHIPAEGVIAHSDMAPERKFDPGPRFDWHRLARQGLAVWPDPVAPDDRAGDPHAFADAAITFGYPAAPPEALLAAFRSRFRPGAAGPLTVTDVSLLAQLAHRFPVDRGASVA